MSQPDGAAGQIRKTFRTEIRNYFVDGKLHYANASNPSIPEALAPHVLGIAGLDNLPRFRHSPVAKLNPQFNRGDGAHALVPADIATIYNITPLHAKGFDGAGQKLVVVGRTDIKTTDVDLFRKTYGLPARHRHGRLRRGNKAAILYVYATDLWDSAKDAIDQNLAPVISMSYTVCEARSAEVPAQAAAFFQLQAQQECPGHYLSRGDG